MALLQLFLALLAISLAAANYVTYSNGSQSGGGTVITDPGSSSGGSQGGVVDRPPTTTTPPPPATTTTVARLSWMAPLARENGDPLLVGEITGYRIRIEKKGSTSIQVKSVGGNTTSLNLSLSGAGTYYFSIAAVDSSGIYSDYSNKVSRIFN